MDSEAKSHRSLPPFVEGKIHSSLRLVIDEVLWLRSPGDVTVVASWWGEHDSAQFRPISSITDTVRTYEDTTKIYAVKTNATLFEDYLKNCGTIELVIIAEKTREIIGTARVGDLSKIFTCKYYTQFVPILSNNGDRIGKVRVSLTYSTKLPNMQLKICKYNKKQEKSDILASVDDLQHDEEMPVTSNKNAVIKKKNFTKSTNNDTCDTYRSVLKTKRLEFQESKKKFNEMVTDKLVAQIVARAQRLRGAILKEAYNDDSLALSDNSMSNGLYSYASAENEAKLYEYILGTEMTSSEEKKALNTLRSTSPTPSLIDLASEMITTSKKENKSRWNENSLVQSNSPIEEVLYEEIPEREMKGAHPLDYVDSIRILIESFTLSPAGYRRAKSTCLQHGVPLSLTYFIQYDTTFGSAGQTNIKSNKEIKLVRTCAKKQVGQVIDFNSEGIYSIQRHIVKKNFPLKFKIFVRHLNQKFPTELGFGSMNINDIANTANLSNTQRIVITNKGIKIGDLRVTAELGCDFTYFGKEFIDTIISAKENIPVLEMKPLSSNSSKYRSATGTHSSKSSSKVSSVSAKRIGCLTSNNNKDLIAMRDIAEHRERSSDNKKIDTSNPESGTKDKVLLHGLIYVAEGKNLPESNTYLICRAFWREDKATSQICSNTKNPFYHFFQLVPLIHGIELLERIRDNYIIIEVYSRQNGETDNLLGIAKLPVHQLYIAYRDPLVLPHLLLSKYPVISVDGWVSINNPVSGESCGELLALVALGTAEQIALLEVSRGLRSASVIPRTVYHCHVLDNTNNATSAYQENLPCNVPEALDLNPRKITRDNHYAYHIYSTSDRDSASADYKSQESQTDISSLRDAEKPEKLVHEVESPEQLALHALVDRLTNALHVNKISTDQSAQTEMNRANEGETNEKELRLNTLNSNSLIDNSNNSCSPRNDFQLPTEMYRSVGVGAEYDEELDRQRNNVYDNPSNSSAIKENAEREELNTECDGSFFRSVVEIECALHLPKMKGPDEFVEPSTYVTFQDLTRKFDSNSQLNSCVTTNVFPHSCNPKWNWKYDAKLPMDLLLNNQKRLILKVWYLIDPDTSMEINLGKDIVIGFSAVDLSVLMAGFPTVSGWFHIMDFTGKCNGQIKISVTPLDSLPLGKFSPTGATNLSRCDNLPQTNWLHLCNTPCSDTTESNNAHRISSHTSYNKDRYAQSTYRKSNEFVAEIGGHGLEDVSMSFLSSSLKQKLTELDEITKRLQSRLSDVTNMAFEDDFDNDFDMIEPNSDNENTDDKNVEITPQSTVYPTNEALKLSKKNNIQDQNLVNNEGQTFTISGNYNSCFEPGSDQVRATSSDATDTGCTGSNTRSIQHLGYYHNQYQNRYGSSTRNYLSSQSNSAEYPARGTRTHINHLLDKLSLDLPPRPPTASAIPMRRDILDLFASLREQRNNLQDKNDRACVDTCSVPTQTDDSSFEPSVYSHATNLVEGEGFSKSSQISKSQPCNRMSTVIREELVAEENNESSNCDELTTYLISSNVRHMDLDCIFNPLLYQHLLPDLQVTTAAVSPEGEAEQLDNQYARSFSTAMMRDNRIDQNLTENKTTLFRNDVPTKNRTSVDSEENVGEFSILTDSDISGNAASNIDVTVIYKSSNNDLMSDNSMESTIDITSFDKSARQIETGNYCTSIVSELSVSGVSRQAPEGGNPVEETKIVSVMSNQQDDIQDVSGDS